MMNKSINNIKEVEVEVEVVECPICMDEIEEKNKVTTECGHCFHTSCLMKNVAHNGFGCPYCRTVMAEEPADNNSDEEYDEFSLDEEEGPDYSDNVLRGARWLFQRAEGEDLDDEEDSVLGEEEVEDEGEVVRPSVDYIVGKLGCRKLLLVFLKELILNFMENSEPSSQVFVLLPLLPLPPSLKKFLPLSVVMKRLIIRVQDFVNLIQTLKTCVKKLS